MVCEAPPPPRLAVVAAAPEAPRDAVQLALICALDPRVIERARRVEFAIRKLRAGMSLPDVRLALRSQFGMSQQYAWKIADMANDLAGPV
jgi:hypothetical protein